MKKSTALEFIEKALVIHGDKYGYDAVEYSQSNHPIKIWCNIHNEYFEQTPKSHLKGCGCSLCGRTRTTKSGMLSLEQFLEQCIITHSNKYDYSKVEYKGGRYKITIICPTHGEFTQNAFSHKVGKGCSKCRAEMLAAKFKDTKEQFIEKARAIHGDKYDYSLVDYINQNTTVDIICKYHGVFSQTPGSHISLKCGCTKCSWELTGWTYTQWENAGLQSKNFSGFKVYIIECWNEEERFYKIGKTFVPIQLRLSAKKRLPYRYKVIKTFEGDARYISELETELQNKHKEFRYQPKLEFGGQTECFTQYLE